MLRAINKVLAILFLVTQSIVSTAAESPVPRELASWSDWVLRDAPESTCPILYNANQHFCAFPSNIKLSLHEKGGAFYQTWTVHQTSWVALPGSAEFWPQQVSANQKPVAVIQRDGRPAVQLMAGTYKVEGKFVWAVMPKSLPIPEASGLVYLTLNNHEIEQPDLRQGQIWLKDTTRAAQENNRLDIQVFRKISDEIPLRMTTSIVLDVSGAQRELTLSGSLLPGFRPAAIQSRLPARLDNQGSLKIQARPGRWAIDVEAFHVTSLTQFPLPKNVAPWPEREVWVYDHQSHLRMVKITNKQSIDPNQTQLPDEWKSLPAYVMSQGDALNVEIIKRGNPDPEPDQLNLNRVWWLDFSGDGLTVQDTITGTLSQHWRLNAAPELELGQVTLDGQPQYITQLPGDTRQGVEVRQGILNMQAVYRITEDKSDIHDLSATGWDSVFNSARAELNLPAGYRLLYVSGAQAPGDWLHQWSLMDFFMVLITSIAVYRLWGKAWGSLALVTLALTWHEYLAPQYIWINLIIAAALLRALSEGRLKHALTIYRNVSALALVILLLGYAVTHVRLTLYPQLEQYSLVQTPLLPAAPAPMPAMTEARETLAEGVMSSAADSYRMLKSEESAPAKRKPEYSMQVDPNALIQTGPGLPNWQWHRYDIQWDGPINQQQRLHLLLMNPFMTKVFNILTIALMVVLAWRLIDVAGIRHTFKFPASTRGITGLLVVLCVVSLNWPSPVMAQYPSQELLKDLQAHLTQPKKCLPECAAIESLDISINASSLRLTMRVHAQDDVALPLPVPVQKWTPSQVTINGESNAVLFRNDQQLWVRVKPGVHRIVAEGRVGGLNQIKMDFSLKPHAFNVNASGWSVDGLDQNIGAINSLTFTRLAGNQAAAKSGKQMSSDIPVFAEIKRQLNFGLDWTVDTTVYYKSGTALPVILRIPLLPGESVITDGIKLEKNQAVITLSDARRRVQWTSRLSMTSEIQLTAANTDAYREIWQLSASPIWHVVHQGIPPIYHQRDGNIWQPQWQPWPGESITLAIVRPEGVPGNTLTIDHSELTLKPGENVTTATLDLNLRSSLGGQHEIRLPEHSDLLSVAINDSALPVRLNKGVLALPIAPGEHSISIKWREPRGVGIGLYKTSAIDLGVAHVNTRIALSPGAQQWVLFVGGPQLGPAVLFWGVLVVILLVAIALSRVSGMPVTLPHWILLGIGLSTTSPASAVLVAGWFFALRWRERATLPVDALKFNVTQVLLLVLTLLSLGTLLAAVQNGLLGYPDMQITGNGSSSYLLNWYTDRSDTTMAQAWMITVPVMFYRIMMLLWAIWMAFALIKWLRWGWDCYSKNGYWKQKRIIIESNLNNSKD